MAKLNEPLKRELMYRFGTVVEAGNSIGIERSRLSNLLNGHVQIKPLEWDRFAGELGPTLATKLLGKKPRNLGPGRSLWLSL
jgi:hypothetical protein